MASYTGQACKTNTCYWPLVLEQRHVELDRADQVVERAAAKVVVVHVDAQRRHVRRRRAGVGPLLHVDLRGAGPTTDVSYASLFREEFLTRHTHHDSCAHLGEFHHIREVPPYTTLTLYRITEYILFL